MFHHLAAYGHNPAPTPRRSHGLVQPKSILFLSCNFTLDGGEEIRLAIALVNEKIVQQICCNPIGCAMMSIVLLTSANDPDGVAYRAR